MYDLLLAGGTVVDGTGAPPRTADVAVDSGLVAEIGVLPRHAARRVLDVAGAVVSPGFIDLHTHADYSLFAAPDAPTQIHQGVTTLVTGNCGFSPFPVTEEHAEHIRSHRALGDDVLPWTWHTTEEFLGAVDALPLGVNVACLVGHGTLRLAAMGAARQPASERQLATMVTLLREAIDAGVVGMSTGLIYAPGSFADRHELEVLCREIAKAGLLYTTHMRNEAGQLSEAIDEAIGTARAAGVRLEISHLKAIGKSNWGNVLPSLETVEDAVRDGVDVAVDVYPYTATSTTLTSRLPAWALDGGTSALLHRLSDHKVCMHMAADVAAGVGQEFRPETIVLADLAPGPYSHFVGHTIVDVAGQLGLDPAMAVLALLREHEGSVRMINHGLSEDDVETALRHPLASVASDGYVLAAEGKGVPHPRSFGTFSRILGHYVRERHLLQLSDAIRKMTALPASRLGWSRRGVVRPGAVADLCVFDPVSVTDRSTFQDPWRLSAGVRHTLVAGQLVLDDGRLTDARPGRVLRGRADG